VDVRTDLLTPDEEHQSVCDVLKLEGLCAVWRCKSAPPYYVGLVGDNNNCQCHRDMCRLAIVPDGNREVLT